MFYLYFTLSALFCLSFSSATEGKINFSDLSMALIADDQVPTFIRVSLHFTLKYVQLDNESFGNSRADLKKNISLFFKRK